MASLKLKVEQRERLYYSKYTYKVTCYAPGAYYAYYAKTIDDCLDQINSIRNEIKRYPTYIPITFGDEDIKNLAKLIAYTNAFSDKDKGTTRREGNGITFFSNDLNFLKKAPCATKMCQVDLLPTGIKYFKREVPAPYRVYFKDTKVSADIKKDLIEYLNRTDNVEPSKSLEAWLHRSAHWATVWMSPSFYINYHDESSLTMMHLMFSGIIGKNYKLEKK